MKFCSCSMDKKERAKQIRELLKKYGDDVPECDIKKITPYTLDRWVTKCDCKGNIIGAMQVKKTDWYLWTVKNGVVHKDLQGKGIGGNLLREIVKKSVDEGAKVLAADITFDNKKSKRMAEKIGFKRKSRFCWAKGQKPADIVHYVLYPPVGTKCPLP